MSENWEIVESHKTGRRLGAFVTAARLVNDDTRTRPHVYLQIRGKWVLIMGPEEIRNLPCLHVELDNETGRMPR